MSCVLCRWKSITDRVAELVTLGEDSDAALFTKNTQVGCTTNSVVQKVKKLTETLATVDGGMCH